MFDDPLRLDRLVIHRMSMRMKIPFTTSFETLLDRDFLLIALTDADGITGWGESVASLGPFYNEETVITNLHIIEDFLVDLLKREPIFHPDDLVRRFAPIRRHYMAKSALEGAVWDLWAKRRNISLATALGGQRSRIDVGISIGIQDSVDKLLTMIDAYQAEGYKRMKIKIKPGWDVDVLRQVRKVFPDIPLMADANSAYTLNDIALLRQLDDLNLTMIEQPLAHDDIVDHAQLQAVMKTPICLDESIHTLDDVRRARALKAARIINIKIGRVGGLTHAREIHDDCLAHGTPVWCGGMLESGVGRAHNIALTTLSGFTIPGDTAASARYWDEDIIEPAVMVEDGTITVPQGPGIGYQVIAERVAKHRTAMIDMRLRPKLV